MQSWFMQSCFSTKCVGVGLARWLVAALLLLSPAFASLGDDVSSVQRDQAHLNASVRVIVAEHFSIQEMQTPAGTTVRQYVSPDGRVFAVSWQGFAPDLQQLLGDYFGEYVAAVSQAAHRGRGVRIDTGELVVETGGHMRYVVGRAFLRSKMPSGVSSDDIR
jgi:Protein of unknown function (DUF2844)